MNVRLGFEVGTGEPVDLPLRHMVVTGQTQEAGKTTALEALIARSGVQAVVFITKRGEGSFADARTIAPYFREQADWKYVAAILEASRGEKLKFERSWIIRASKGARSLADVQRNVRKFLADPKTKGINADVYLTLEAYLDDVVPEIERVRWAQEVQLMPGLAAMDLGGLKVEMQHLVIRSTLEWVLEHAQNTVVVVPEAWKFIPQGRGTPVKLAAEAYIRQAAAMKNYLWLDSQDIAGVEKMILKSVPVWVLGVQREANEVKRTLDQIPAGIKKPKADQVATLGLGEFFACHGTHVTKVYVQPAWLPDGLARQVALGEMRADANVPLAVHREVLVTPEEAQALRDENTELRQRVADLEAITRQSPKSPAPPDVVRRVLETGEARNPQQGDRRESPVVASLRAAAPMDGALVGEELYQAIKERLAVDAPRLLKILLVKPEIEVEVVRETVRVDGKTLKGRVARLIADGFFDTGRLQSHVIAELERHGLGVSDKKNLPRDINSLVEMGFLTIEDGKDNNGRARKAYQAVRDMKVNIVAA